MRTLFKIFSITLLMFLGTSSFVLKPTQTTDEQKLRKLTEDTYYAVCNGNWELFSNSWYHSSKVHLMHPDNGVWLKGWEEIKSIYEPSVKSGMKCNISVNDLVINISKSGEMAWVITDITVKYGNDPNSQPSHMWEIVVWEKIDGQWKGVLAQSTTPKISIKE